MPGGDIAAICMTSGTTGSGPQPLLALFVSRKGGHSSWTVALLALRGLADGSELPAGRRDVSAARQSHSRRDPCAVELPLEPGYRLPGRSLEHPGRVVGDQVHLEDLRVE